jgi:hypothetical protein
MPEFLNSLEAANLLYTWGWRASMFGALITFIGVAALYLGTRVRDHDFEHSMATLHKQAGVFEKEAGEARERAGKLELRAAGLENEAAQARLALELLKQTLVDRTISREQAEILKSMLAGRNVTVGIMWPTTDREVDTYAKQLKTVLENAGVKFSFTVNAAGSIIIDREPVLGRGISLMGRNEPNLQLLANALASAKIQFEIEAPPRGFPYQGPTLVIGSRPTLRQ